MMKSLVFLLAVATMAVTAVAQTPATLTDIGVNQPLIGADDIYQTNWLGGAQSPDGLNYYTDNGTPPGETFTTGSNPDGYLVKSLALQTAGNSGQLPAQGQAYLVNFYAVSAPANASLIGQYISANNFTFTDDDWLQWSGLNVALAPNSQYAYSFGRIASGSGWENMASYGGAPTIYVGGVASAAGGDVALIPPSGGTMQLGASSNYVATFILGLSVASNAPVVSAPAFSPSSAVTAGTAVTVSVAAVGAAPLTYQWKTDGGSGGTVTNIPGATSGTLSVDTANWNPGPYQYAVGVSNSDGGVISPVSSLGIRYPTAAATLTDAGQNITSGAYDISQFIGGGPGIGLNYYDDNGANHGYYAGQTFTTGTNTQGYYIDTLAVQTGGTGGSGSTSTKQFYHLFIYSMSGNNATLLAHYTNNPLLGFTFGDWLVWSGFSLALKPNATYAYGFGRDASGTGWAALNYSPSNAPGPLPNNVICLLPQDGGAIQPGAGNSAAVFDAGMLPIGVGPSPAPFANPIGASPNREVIAGTQVTLNENATGQAPLNYYWQTDGGTGTITNLPGNNSSNLVVDTTGWTPGVYQYDVVASNSFGASKSAVLDLTILYADTNADLEDIGTTTPSIEANDVAQPVVGTSQDVGGNPDGLNYYFDNASPPGQTFKTGSSAGGYVLTTLALPIVDEYSTPATGQNYFLRLYRVSGPTATIVAVYESEPNFIWTGGDWLRWSGFAVPLAANTTYAYTFGRDPSGSGWGSPGSVSNSPPVYDGGACVIPATGGQIVYSHSGNQDATFIAGMALAQDPAVAPPVYAPSGTIYAGTTITLSAGVSGPGPYTYQWVTDGGGGGALTNVPGATSATLNVNTTTLAGQNVTYALIVSNGAGSSTSETVVVSVSAASAPTVVNDIYPAGETMFAGGSVEFSASFAGTEPITYQWKVDKGTGATNITGQTGDTLTLGNLTTADSGTYSVAANNSVGAGASGNAVLTVVPVPTPPFTVNFQWHSTEGGNDVGNYNGAGIPGYGAGTFWNQVVGPSAFTPGTYGVSNAVTDNGTTPAGFQWVLMTGGSWDWTSTPTIPLLDSGASANYPTPQTFTFTLPSGIYNMVFFSCDGTQSLNRDSISVITVGGASQTVTPTNDTAFIEGETYAVFKNVVVTGTTINGTWAAGSATQNLASLNGAQLQYLGPIITLVATPVGSGQVQLRWPQGTLLQAPSVTGPWTTNSGVSPLTVSATGPQMFYKVIAP